MDEIKPFSEDISYGREEFGAGARLVEQLEKKSLVKIPKTLVPATPIHAKDLLKIISRGGTEVQLPVRGGWISYPISQEYFNHAKSILKNAIKTASPSDKATYEKFLKVKYPEAKMANAIKIIASDAVFTTAKKEGIKLTAKSVGKYLIKVAPWIAAGVVGKQLYDRIKDLITKDSKSESNHIPFGEFYHKDKGWY